MLADVNRLHPILPAGIDNLLIRKQPNLDVQMRQLARRDGRKAMVVGGRPAGSMHQGVRQRHALAQKAAAAAKPTAPLDAHKSPEHRQFRRAGQVGVRELQIAALGRRFQHANGTSDDCRFLIGGQLAQLGGRRRRHSVF